jgi:peptidoglycan/LPS O-acetylase OafA/YrhL
VVDKSKLPSGLVVVRVWVPETGSEPRRPIAYVTERRRRIVGAVLIVLGLVLGLAVLVSRTAFWLAFVPLLVSWIGIAYGAGGRTGFYELNDDGGLGEYLGQWTPEVGSMRPRKPPN